MQMQNNRGISLNIPSYYLVFLDISILNIFTISRYCRLSCFLRASNTLTNAKESRKCEVKVFVTLQKHERQQYRETVKIFKIEISRNTKLEIAIAN